MVEFFCFGDSYDAKRIYLGRHDPEKLTITNYFGFKANGNPLLDPRTTGDSDIANEACMRAKWCGLGPVTPDQPAEELKIPGRPFWSETDRFVFRITPSTLENVYVADQEPFNRQRARLFQGIGPRTLVKELELTEAKLARARTLVAFDQYDGSYAEPVILFRRDIGFDEIELVSGPWPEYQYVRQVLKWSSGKPELLIQGARAWRAYGDQPSFERRQSLQDAAFALNGGIADAIQEQAKYSLGRQKDGHMIDLILSTAWEALQLGLLK